MVLTVGTDSYDSLANVDAYHAARNNVAWAAVVDDNLREGFIREASDWVDRNFVFVGKQATADQRLAWPRMGAAANGHDISDTIIPRQVAEAVAIVAELYRAGVADLDGLVSDAAAVTSEKVDVIAVTYDASLRTRGPDVPTNVHQLLRPLTSSGGLGQGSLLRA